MFLRRMAPLVVASVLVATCSSSANPYFVDLSGPMPNISGATLTGGWLHPADYQGRIVVVNFWNYDCPPCRQEQPVLQKDWEALAGKGVSFIGVMFVGGIPPWPNDHGAARGYLEEFGVTYPAIVDEDSSIAEELGVPGIPTTVVADRGGELRFRILGRVRPGQLEHLIEELG